LVFLFIIYNIILSLGKRRKDVIISRLLGEIMTMYSCHDLARDYLAIGHTDTYLDSIKHSNMFDFCYDLTRDYIIIKYTGKNLDATRIFNIRTRILGYNYDYMAKIMAEVLI